ncbi:AAA family ATPase [Actinokineospora spheciospongiae]|uniref:AAA family ATPase n=1 Tax=Actinokineospora spheciospongiae TaxID=909613 RepID=UPI001F1BDEAC|nr:AAA family ATPase [Actinokineospora spheciospongiae]
MWLNGPFGAGKTSAARELTGLLPRARVFDSEEVGFMLRHVLTEPVADFQDWPAWRALVVHTAAEVLSQVGGTLVVPQAVLDRGYAEEIFAGLRGRGIPVVHVVLHVELGELVRRITRDEVEVGAVRWRLDHVGPYFEALGWLCGAATVVDTTVLSPRETAVRVAGVVSARDGE